MSPHRQFALAVALMFCPVPVLAQDCSPLQPSKPVDTEVSNKTTASANILLKSLGSGDVSNEYKKVENDVLSKYPNADKTHTWDSFVYMLCTLLKSSTSLTDKEKLDRYEILLNTWTSGPPRTNQQERNGQVSRPQPKTKDSQNIKQNTTGNCSSAVANVTGGVNITCR
jgi:hypothetical protein